MTHSWIFLTLSGILGLIVGSFLNVVIHRLPIMLKISWRQDCLEFLNQTPDFADEVKCYNLARPNSHCPFCNTPIKRWHNIPVLSYLFLGGKCANCESKIPLRYLIVELLSFALSVILAWQFGLSWTFVAVLTFTWFLIAISFIDIDHQILPDSLTMPLLWIGLFISCFDVFASSHDAILGAIFGYLFFWIVDKLFKLVRRKEGIGQGDFKLIAVAGAWLGWQLLPFVILSSSIFGILIGGGWLLCRGKSHHTPIPFGPFIAIAMFIGIIWGFDITQMYLQIMGINIPLANV
jgi:leader peptidase (prepilin peptidase) / N-methyltransferase